ncbi:MAG: CinA family nicotinamide mononucleotide deamidase-related protein [Chitinophagaceae bacterium]|nr:CinA family nicotinamide mononucleotide deamidase-related protein [Chitinophagaceae bacterium]
MSKTVASVITIGDELLIGQTIDTNSAWIGKQLNALGIDLRRRVAVGDDKKAITDALNEELANAQLVIVTGGLGPTADDITKPLLLEYFGGKMVVNERVLEHVKDLFAKRNRPFLERNMKQAEVPETCSVLFNRMGTAPGMWFERDGRVVISLPGVPFEMISIMQEEALPRIKERFTGDAIVHLSVITAGEGESFVAEKIQDLEEALPAHIKLAYLPGAGMVKLRLTGHGTDEAALTEEMRPHQMAIANRLEDIVISLTDEPMEAILHRWFTRNGKTLALAESCTGGYMAHLLTQVSGSSKYFRGGIVVYQTDVKLDVLGVSKEVVDTNGVVSDATALAMAQQAGTVLKADYAFGITGMLEPPIGDDRSTGMAWMAVAGPDGRTLSRRYVFHYDRHRNKEMAASMGLLMLYKFVTDGTRPWREQ